MRWLCVYVCVCMYYTCVTCEWVCERRFSQRHPFASCITEWSHLGMIAFLSGFSERLFNFKEWCVEESDTRIHIFTHMHEKAKEKRWELHHRIFSPFLRHAQIYRRFETVKKTLIIMMKDHIVKNGSPAPKSNFLVPICYRQWLFL